MALFSKKVKKKNETATDENTIPAQWKVFNNRESFSLIFQGEDISERVVVEMLDDDAVIFDPEVGIYFLLKGINSVAEDEIQDVIGYFAADGVACISIDELKTYYCFYEGENVSSNTQSFWINEDLCIWVAEDEDYHLLKYSENPVDNELLIPQCLESDNGTLWYKDGESGFWLMINGEAIAPHTNSDWVGDDYLVYDYESGTWYYFVDYETAPPFTPFSAAVLEVEGKYLWTKSSNENHFIFYKEGKSISNSLNAIFVNDDLIVFIEEENAHYLMQDFRNVELFNLYEPVLLPNNTDAVWLKPNSDEFMLYVRGNNISSDVTPRMMEGSLLLLHRPTNMIYMCPDYEQQPLNEFLPAATMEAGKFLHYFD